MSARSLAAITMIGNWDSQVNNGLQTALKVLINTTNKTLPEAVGRCLVGMAQAVRLMTKKAKKQREVFKDGKVEFVQVYRQDGNFTLIPRWKFSADGYRYGLKADWEQAKRIGNAGMAQRSWFWGLRGLPGAPYAMGGKPYPGIAKRMELIGRGANPSYGPILQNRLSYIIKTVPTDYEARATQQAGNKIMADAARKLQVDVGHELNRLNIRGVAE